MTLALVSALALAAVAAVAPSAGAESAVTFPGSPLTLSIGPLGQCESAYGEHGNNFYPPSGTLGDCGFFLAFPKPKEGKFAEQPTAIEGKTFGFTGTAGPGLPSHYTEVSQSAVSGAGTGVSPYAQTTVFKVEEEEASVKHVYAEITETTTYVNGEPQFVSSYNVKNVTSPAKRIYFRAIYAGDLFLLGNDFGTGQFLAGPPRFVGGQNPESGTLGGLEEASGALAWSNFQEGCWNDATFENPGRCSEASPTDAGIWHIVRESVEEPNAFNNTVDPALIDNAVGVEWDQLRETGLAGGAEQSFSIINRTQVPSTLQVSPVSQTLTQGQTETINVTATDLAGIPYSGKVLHYTVAGSNPQTGTITLNGAGQAQISYVGTNAGADTIQMFVDLTGSGVQATGDPAGTATVTWLPKPPPPTPNSTYKVQSIKVNSNGTITITFVPTQNGTGTLEVTVPTGTIARREAEAAKKKKKKCKKGQTRIKGKCRPTNTLSGKVSASGVAGVPLTISVKPSSKVLKALKKGKTVLLTAKLTYKSSLGGTPTVEVFHEKIKPKKKHKK